MKKGKTIAQYKGKLIHLKWKNKNDANMLSTIHNEERQKITVAGKEFMKPTICIEYNKNHMAGVDLMDQITSAASFVRKGLKKFFKKKFFRLIEICLQNSHCIYKKKRRLQNFAVF